MTSWGFSPRKAGFVAATMSWFYLRGDEKVGPISQDELCEMFRRGLLTLQTMVWTEAFDRWTPASSIAALRALSGVSAPQPSLEAAGPSQRAGFDYVMSSEPEGPVGIAGWLVLPALAMIFNPIRQAFQTLGLWILADRMNGPAASQAVDAGHSLRIFAVMSGILCAYQLYTATLFFSKKAS